MTIRFTNKIYVAVCKLFLMLWILCTVISCKKYNLDRTNPRDFEAENYNPQVPIVSTTALTSISSTSASFEAAVSSDGNSRIVSRGICFGLNLNPQITDNKELTSGALGEFAISLSGLIPCTIYHARAYATNSVGTGYGDDFQFKTNCEKITDIEGNIYNTERIGTQLWMKENLKTTKYNDGTSIPLVTDPTVWSNVSTVGYCWYNNDAASNMNVYGALYNWSVSHNSKICPAGWHVPDDTEWLTLQSYLGGESVAGGKLKEIGISHWSSPNTGATDESGFMARPGGLRSYNGSFGGIWDKGYWWSYSYNITLKGVLGRGFLMSYDNSSFTGPTLYSPNSGLSIRCLKDN